MGSRVSYWTWLHEPWLESWFWAVRIMATIDRLPVMCQALCWALYHPTESSHLLGGAMVPILQMRITEDLSSNTGPESCCLLSAGAYSETPI